VVTVVEKLVREGLRYKVDIAFSAGIRLESIKRLKTLDINILEMERGIVDVPLVDMRLEIVGGNEVNNARK
jgi:nicotinate-nucleotide pyrophosphorylase